MKRKFLEDLGLEKEVIDKILDENSSDIGAIKEELTTVTKEKEKLESDIAERNAQLETLKESAGSVDDLKAQIAKLQADNAEKDKTHKAEMDAFKIDTAVDKAITGAKGKNVRAIKALLNMDEITLDKDGNVVGYSEQLENLMKADDSKFLFDTPQDASLQGFNPAASGNNPGGNNGGVDMSKMTYEQIVAMESGN